MAAVGKAQLSMKDMYLLKLCFFTAIDIFQYWAVFMLKFLNYRVFQKKVPTLILGSFPLQRHIRKEYSYSNISYGRNSIIGYYPGFYSSLRDEN